MRISDWSSDVCSSDLPPDGRRPGACKEDQRHPPRRIWRLCAADQLPDRPPRHRAPALHAGTDARRSDDAQPDRGAGRDLRSEEHTSELQSLMRISYAVFCLKKKKTQKEKNQQNTHKNTDTTTT